MTVRSERPTLYWVPVCQTGHVWKNTYAKNGTNFSDTAVGFFMSLLCSLCHLFPTAKVFKIVCQCFLQVKAVTIAPVWISILRSFCLSRFFTTTTSCFKDYSSQRWNLSQHVRVRSKSDPSLSRKFRAISSRTCYMIGPWFRIFVDIIRYVVARPLGHYYRQLHPVGPDRTR